MIEKLYEILLGERENDSKRYWAIFSLMNIVNAGLLAILSTGNVTVFEIFIPIVGIVLCFIWFFAGVRMMGWIELWENKIKFIEEYYIKHIDLPSECKKLSELDFNIFRKRENPYRWTIIPTRWIGMLLALSFGVVWIYIFLIRIIKETNQMAIYGRITLSIGLALSLFGVYKMIKAQTPKKGVQEVPPGEPKYTTGIIIMVLGYLLQIIGIWIS